MFIIYSIQVLASSTTPTNCKHKLLIGVMLLNVISYYNLHTYKRNEVLVVALVCLASTSL